MKSAGVSTPESEHTSRRDCSRFSPARRHHKQAGSAAYFRYCLRHQQQQRVLIGLQCILHTVLMEQEQPNSSSSRAEESSTPSASVDNVIETSSIRSQEHSYTELYHNPDVVFERLKEGRHLTKELRSFYQEFSAIEQTYAKSILKLCTSQNFTAHNSLDMSLTGLLRFGEDSSRLRLEFATKLHSGMSESLQTIGEELKRERIQMSAALADAKKKLKQQAIICDKAHSRYACATREVEREVQVRIDLIERGSTEKQMERQEKRVQDAITIYKQKRQAYTDAILKHNEALDAEQKATDYILQNLGAGEVARVRKMQSSLLQMHEAQSALLTSLARPLRLLEQSVANVQPMRDADLFVQENSPEGALPRPAPRRFLEVHSAVLDQELEGYPHFSSSSGGDTKSFSSAPPPPATTWSGPGVSDTDPSSSAPAAAPAEDTGESSSRTVRTVRTNSLDQVMAALNCGGGVPSVQEPAPPTEAAEGDTEPSFVRTVYEFREDDEQYHSFDVGEFIFVTEGLGDEWARGKLHGLNAIYPRAFTEPHQAKEAIVLYNYEGLSASELSLSEGERCFILDDSDAGWIWVADASGERQGNFPRSYCTL